jgi:hypothetical protein
MEMKSPRLTGFEAEKVPIGAARRGVPAIRMLPCPFPEEFVLKMPGE